MPASASPRIATDDPEVKTSVEEVPTGSVVTAAPALAAAVTTSVSLEEPEQIEELPEPPVSAAPSTTTTIIQVRFIDRLLFLEEREKDDLKW